MDFSHISKQQRMTSKKDSGHPLVQPQLLPSRSHLHFAHQQPTIHRTHSLKQVDSSLPTFTPHINELPFQIYPTRTKTEVSKLQIQERLIDNQRQKAESLRAQRLTQEDQTWKDYCTFQPSISAETKKIASRTTKQKQAHERLYEQGISKIKSLQECTQFLTESDKENCTFRPNANKQPTENQTFLAPLYQRLQKIIADKKQYLKKLEQEQQESLQIREKPEVNAHTNSIVQSKESFKKNVLDRLFSFMRDKNDRLQKMAEQKQEQIKKQCTFQPELNYHSSSVHQGDFLERQEKEAQKVKENMMYLQEINQAAFQPNINKVSALLIEAERADETQDEKLMRLHRLPQLERQAQLEQLQEQCYKECTFQPQINALSKDIKGAPHQHRCNCHPKQEHYHFHPQINPKSREMAQKPKQKEKEEITQVQLVRMQLEYRQMKECTFHPKTVGDRFRSASQRTSLKEVKGADSYSKRIEKVKARKKQEQQLRSKVFEIEKKYVNRKQTKAQPFKLSVGVQKLQKLREQAEQQFRKQYTFKPDTANKLR